MVYKLVVFELLISLFVMSSCYVYHPQNTDIPLINEKNDLRLDAGITYDPIAEDFPSANATISYGLTNSIPVQLFGSIGNHDRFYLQGATGYYKKFNNQAIIEMYGGFGYGYSKAFRERETKPGGILYGNYQLYYYQLNFGKLDNDFLNMDCGIGLKLGYLHSNFTDKNFYNFYSTTGPYEAYNDHSFTIEPNGFVRFGGKKLKLNIKLSGCLIYNSNNANPEFPFSYIILGIGLNYHL